VIGATLGTLIGKLVVYLRTRHREAVGLDEFLALGLVALTYGFAVFAHASTFFALFAAGLALQRIKGRSPTQELPQSGPAGLQDKAAHVAVATHPELAGAYMMQAVRGFNEQLERIAELAMVLLVGSMLSLLTLEPDLYWFLPLLFVVLRPLAVYLGLLGTKAAISLQQRALISWFGIRGVGSIYYLIFAIGQGIPGAIAEKILSITLATVAASIVIHGISVTPLMSRYTREAERRKKRRAALTGGTGKH